MADQRADHRRKLEEMKKVLVTDEDFGRVYRIFFDEVACHRSFMALGKKEKSPLLKTTLRLVGESLFGVLNAGVIVASRDAEWAALPLGETWPAMLAGVLVFAALAAALYAWTKSRAAKV